MLKLWGAGGLAAILLVLGVAVDPTPAQAFACWECQYCLGGGHKMIDGRDEYEGGHSFCLEDTCDNGHPSCGATMLSSPEVDRLLASAASGDPGAARELVERWPGQIHWNHVRHALQLTAACLGGEYFGNLPLTSAQEAALTQVAD